MILKCLGCLGVTMIMTCVGWRARMRDELEGRVTQSNTQELIGAPKGVYMRAYKTGREFGLVNVVFSIFIHGVVALLCTLGRVSAGLSDKILVLTELLLIFTVLAYIKKGGSYLYKELWTIITCILASTILNIMLH